MRFFYGKRLYSRKKGALELSINAIVIIVLAMTLLGLGLTFIRGQFKQFTKTTLTVQKQVEEQILEDLRTGDKKLSFPSTDVTLDKGATGTFALGVKNTQGTGDLDFNIEIVTKAVKGTSSSSTVNGISFFFNTGPYVLGPADSEVYPFQVTDVDKNAETYQISITIKTSEGITYAEKTFFLTVG